MNAKHLMSGAIVGALALAGCMSLEERLASNDAQVRREAEYELVSQARKSGKVDECIAAAGRVSDPQLLLAIAQSSPNGYEKEGITAVGKISDEPSLLTISKTAKSEKVAEAALAKLTKQESLLDVAKGAQLQAARLGAYMRLNDQGQLLQVAMTSQDNKIKRAAIDKVTDQEKLLPMVFAPKASPELVDAFIAKCTNDNVLLRLVKEHGAQLTDAQCAAIKGKTKNQSLLKMIDSVSDLKIAAQARASKDPKKYSEFLDAIHNDDIRHDLCVDILQRLNSCIKLSSEEYEKKYGEKRSEQLRNFAYSVHFSQRKPLSKEDEVIVLGLVNCLNDDEIQNLLTCQKINEDVLGEDFVDGLKQVIAGSFTLEKRLIIMRKLADAKGRNVRSYQRLSNSVIKDLSEGRAKALDVIKELSGHNIGRFGWNLPAAICDAIKSSAEAEAFLASDFIVGLDDDKSYSKRLMDTVLNKVIPLVGEQERLKGITLAKKRLAERKPAEFTFGSYYVGMPIYDAELLAINDGISNGVVFGYDVAELKKIAKDWKTDLKVTWIRFTRKGALKYLDCEDSTILQQTLKQYVKKEKGKANAYDYASEIKHDLDISTSRDLDAFSPTGTRLNVDSEMWNVYTNTRMGIRIQYGEKNGFLLITALAD